MLYGGWVGRRRELKRNVFAALNKVVEKFGISIADWPWPFPAHPLLFVLPLTSPTVPSTIWVV